MSLLCQIGIHKPGCAVTNGGCAFATCRRCGKNLVKAGQGRWHVPRGYRVVWKSRAEAATDVLLSRQLSPRGGETMSGGGLPVQALLRELQTGDIMKEEAGSGAWDADIRVGADTARSRVKLDDFMQRKAADRPYASRQPDMPRQQAFPEAASSFARPIPRSNGAG